MGAGESAAKQVAAAMALSVAAHVLAALVVVLVPVVLPGASAPSYEGEITLLVDEAAPLPTDEHVARPVHEEDPPPSPVETRARTAPVPRPIAPAAALAATTRPPVASSAVASTGATPSTAIDPVPSPEARESRAERDARLALLLAPDAVARSALRLDPGEGPSQRRGPQSDVRVDPGPGMMGEAEAEAQLAGHLRERALARPWPAHVPLTARPRPDGTYAFTSHAFTAVIHPDGSVRYSDRDPITGDLLQGGGEWTIDVNDLLMGAAGGDPYAAERLRFEEDNAELIERLDREHRRQTMDAALRRLPGELTMLWSRAGSAEERRGRIVARWRDLDDGPMGDPARRAVEAWVRENLPAGSEHAFTAAEIAALERGPGPRFAPYR